MSSPPSARGSNYAKGTLLVVAAGQTRQAELERAAEKFAQAKAPLVGIVLNEVTKQSGYGRYGTGDGHGSHTAATPGAARSGAAQPGTARSLTARSLRARSLTALSLMARCTRTGIRPRHRR